MPEYVKTKTIEKYLSKIDEIDTTLKEKVMAYDMRLTEITKHLNQIIEKQREEIIQLRLIIDNEEKKRQNKLVRVSRLLKSE